MCAAEENESFNQIHLESEFHVIAWNGNLICLVAMVFDAKRFK
jgi:hypothetical protein